MVYERRVGTGDELIRRIFDDARRINDLAILRKVTFSVVERFRAHPSWRRQIWTFLKL